MILSRPVLPSVSPSITALSITDELADRERRKNNIIVYNFTETSDHQTDKDSFVNFCSSVFNCNVKSVKYYAWRSLCLPFLDILQWLDMSR